jgi:hypothetical protein
MGMSITDTVMMGWSGPEALAAGAVVSDLYSIVYYFMAGILSASGAGIGRASRRRTSSGAAPRILRGGNPDYPSVLLGLEHERAASHVRR